jgi:hypothetical protein
MSTSFAIPIVAMILIGLALGTLINFGFAFLAIPIVGFIFINWFFASEMMQRQRRIQKMNKFRRDARARKVGFTEQDKRTVI